MSYQNDRRANRASVALSAYKGTERGPVDGETVVDLLVDLHHFLAREGEAYPEHWLDDSLRVASGHFVSETNEIPQED